MPNASSSARRSVAGSWLLAGLVLGAACGPAWATVTTYSSALGFSAAVAGEVSYGFGGIAAPGTALFTEVDRGGLHFASTVYPFVIDAAATPYYGASFFSGQSPDARPSDVLVSSGGSTALGFEFGSYISTPGSPVTIALSSGDVFVVTLPTAGEPRTKFFGFVSSAPITSVSFTTIANPPGATDIGYSIDLVHFSVATAVPEPASLALLLAGLGFIAARRVGRTDRA